MKRLLFALCAFAAGASAAWRPEEPLELWEDGSVAAAPGARTNALGAAFSADTGFVPEAGAFTASALLRVDDFAPMPERMEWRNGMAFCCGSGYYDGFRLFFHDASEFRPVFEIGRPQGAVSVEGPVGLSTGAWHHVAVAWEPSGDPATNGTMSLFVDGRRAAVSPPDRPAPILRGESIKAGYVDFGVGALRGAVAAVSFEPRALSRAEVAAAFAEAARALPDAPPELLREAALAVDPPPAPPSEATDASALFEVFVADFPAPTRDRLLSAATWRWKESMLDAKAGNRRMLRPDDCGDDVAGAIESAVAELAAAGGGMLSLDPGVYPVRRTIELRGAAACGVHILGHGAVLDGSAAIPRAAFAPLGDSAVRLRLTTVEACDEVLSAPAPAGMVAPTPCGVGTAGPRRGVLLFADGTNELALARCPRAGWREAEADPATGRFVVRGWPCLPVGAEALAQGWWRYDWADATLPVRAEEDETFALLSPHGYGLAEHPRVALLGRPEFLGLPGEWCLADGSLLLWPPEGGFEEVRVPMLDGPLLRIEGSGGVRIEGLSLRGTAGDALRAHAATNLDLAVVSVSGVGGTGFDLDGCDGAFVHKCRVERTGHGGLRLAAGSRESGRAPRPGWAMVADCVFSRNARLALCYQPGVLLEGCGGLVAGCSFEDQPSSAIRLEGNDHAVAGCVFRRCVLESDDQGAIDLWGDPTYRGNVVAFNLFEDVGAGGMHACGRAAVRLDDLISGTQIYGNLFRRASRGNFGAVQVHGGQHNRIFANAFEDCGIGISFDPWGAERWRETLESDEIAPKLRGRADDPAWRRYCPDLERLRDEPDANLAAGNLFVRCSRAFRRKIAAVRAFCNRDAD